MKSIAFVLNTIVILILLLVVWASIGCQRPTELDSTVASKCIAPKVERDEQPWTDQDQLAFDQAEQTCRTKYRRCLVRFVRIEHGNYHAICGGT